MILPNTYLIGVQKAGTTSLNYWISQHPDIYAPLEFKDVDYFADPDRVSQIEDRFKKDYAGHNHEKIILQSQVNYIFYPNALRRIKQKSPDAKLIVVLRDPVERAVSAYKYFKKLGVEEREPEQALIYPPKEHWEYSRENSDFTYIEHGLYGRQLMHVFQDFDREQVIIIPFRDLKSNPEMVCKKVFEYLQIDPEFKPEFKKKNQTGRVKSEWMQKILTHPSSTRRWIIKAAFDRWLPLNKRQQIRKRLIELNTKQPPHTEFSDEITARLKVYFEEDQKILRELLGSNINNNIPIGDGKSNNQG